MGCLCARPREKEPEPRKPPSAVTRRLSIRKDRRASRLRRHSSGLNQDIKAKAEAGPIRQLLVPVMTMFSMESIEISDDKDTISIVRYLNTSELCMLRSFAKPHSELLPETRQKLAEEGGLLCRLDHPNISRTYELIEDPQTFSILSEYPKGGSLLEKLIKLPLISETLAARIMTQILGGLYYCHSQGVSHLRLKMSDLMLSEETQLENWVVRIAGWEKGREFAKMKTSKASPSVYLAPEVFDNQGCEKSDVWSCAVILYMILCGEPPISTANYVQCFLEKQPAPVMLTSKNFVLSPSLESLLRSMLAWKVDSRLTVSECLKSTWMTEKITRGSMDSTPVKNSLSVLAGSQACSMLKKAIKQFIIENVKDQSEVTELAETFKTMDINGDGQLSIEELMIGLGKIMPANQAKEEAKRIMHLADQNGNGLMDYSEFLTSSYNEKRLLSHDNLFAAFKRLDINGSGTVRMEELGIIFLHMKEKEKKKLWRDLTKALNQAGVDTLSYRDFAELVLKLSA